MCKKPEMKSKCKNRVTQKKMVIDIQPIFASVTAELVRSDISSVSNSIKKWEKFMMDTLLDWHPHYSLHEHFIVYLKLYSYFYIQYPSLSILISISVAYNYCADMTKDECSGQNMNCSSLWQKNRRYDDAANLWENESMNWSASKVALLLCLIVH